MDYQPGGDIFASDAECIINPVNCVGVMGKGLALAFKKKFPGIVAPYEDACMKRQMRPGSVQMIGVFRDGRRAPKGEAEMVIANLATKDHWRNDSQLDWVDQGLGKLAGAIEARGIRSVAIPMLGAGLGGLPWRDVRGCVEKHFRPLAEKGVRVTVLGEGPETDRETDQAGEGESNDVQVPLSDDVSAYAGIGARKTPEAVLRRMHTIGSVMAEAGYTLRSGAAEGADSAFEEGCDAVGGKKEIFLPWDGFDPKRDGNKRFKDDVSVFVPPMDGKLLELARRYHPAFDRLGRGAQSLMARNGNQMFGRHLNAPSKLVVCWTEGGDIKGGTGQALRTAKDAGAQVLNLGDPRMKGLTGETLGGMACRMMKGELLKDVLADVRKTQRREEAMAR